MKIANEDSATTGYYDFDNTGSNAYLRDSRKRDTAALKMLNLTNGKLTLLAEDKRADISIFTRHATKKISKQ